jgi:ribosomal protein L29
MKNKELLKELRGLNSEVLVKRGEDLAQELFKLRVAAATGQEQQTHRFKKLKRDLARVNTVLQQKKVA